MRENPKALKRRRAEGNRRMSKDCKDRPVRNGPERRIPMHSNKEKFEIHTATVLASGFLGQRLD